MVRDIFPGETARCLSNKSQMIVRMWAHGFEWAYFIASNFHIYIFINIYIYIWLVVSTPLKNIS